MKLPIGIQTFSQIRGEGYYYVDKTPLVAKLAEGGKYYFLSRPRRFGKSLLVSTLAEAFAGNQALFEGLYLADHWDWGRQSPVVTLDLSQGVLGDKPLLDRTVSVQLAEQGARYGIGLSQADIHLQFRELIHKLHAHCGERVVVLIDEYDKPILDHITEPEKALAMREGLRNLYSVLKAQDAHLRFVLLTGVSKFSKVNLFSGLNNLMDITLDRRYATLCGYTQSELETVFADRLTGLDRERVKKWYNGYCWLGEPVYNPFDILLLLDSGEFRNYWFETGTPDFLIRLLHQSHFFIPHLERICAGEALLSSFDVDFIQPETLLFQTGYLTIEKTETLFDLEKRYHLGFPNHEVKKGLSQGLLQQYCQSPYLEIHHNQLSLLNALKANDMDGLKTILEGFFASIPHDWYRKNQLARYEGYYASVVYCYFAALGLDVRAEESTHQGRIDLVVRFEGRVYILEFKVTELAPAGNALQQIKRKGYAKRFAGQSVYLIGVEFSSQKRNIAGFEWEAVSP
jgi:hypothetical protein